MSGGGVLILLGRRDLSSLLLFLFLFSVGVAVFRLGLSFVWVIGNWRVSGVGNGKWLLR